MIAKVHVKKNDQVVVISGPEEMKGKQGKILSVIPKTGKVVVEGVAYVSKHQQIPPSGSAGRNLSRRSAPLDASNVMLICPKCGKATRVSHKSVDRGKRQG